MKKFDNSLALLYNKTVIATCKKNETSVDTSNFI